MNIKYIPTVEFTKEELRISISRFCVDKKTFIVVKKERKKGEWVKGDKLVNSDIFQNFLKIEFNTFEKTFNVKLETINFILPDHFAESWTSKVTKPINVNSTIGSRDWELALRDICNINKNDYKKIINVYRNGLFYKGKKVSELAVRENMLSSIDFRAQLIAIDINIYKILLSISQQLDKKINKIGTTSDGYNALCQNEAKNSSVNVIVNVDKYNTSVSMFSNNLLYKVKQLKFGLDNIVINNLGNYLSTNKKGLSEKYAYKLLNFFDAWDDEEIIYQKNNNNGTGVGFKAKDLKQIVLSSLSNLISSVDRIIDSLIENKQIKFNLYYLGKVNKIVNFNNIVKNISKYSKDYKDITINVVGASENWTNSLCGFMYIIATAESIKYEKYQRAMKIKMQNEVMRQRTQTVHPFTKTYRPNNISHSQTRSTPRTMSNPIMQNSQTNFKK